MVTLVWRDPSGRPANLARLLQPVEVRAVDHRLGREGGVLLSLAGTEDAVDASVMAASGRAIASSPVTRTTPARWSPWRSGQSSLLIDWRPM